MTRLQNRSRVVSFDFASLELNWEQRGEIRMGRGHRRATEADFERNNSVQRDIKGISELWQKDGYGSETVVDRGM